jgi:hypothetical protein
MNTKVNSNQLSACAHHFAKACAAMTVLLGTGGLPGVEPTYDTTSSVVGKKTVAVKTAKPLKVKIKPAVKSSEALAPVADITAEQELLAVIITDLARAKAWDQMEWQEWEASGILTKKVFLTQDGAGRNALYWLLRNAPASRFHFARCFAKLTLAELDLIEMQSNHSRAAIEFTERVRDIIIPEYRLVMDNNVYAVGDRLVLVGYSTYSAGWGWRLRELNGRVVTSGAHYKRDLLAYIKEGKMKLTDCYKNGTDTRWHPVAD